MKHANHKKYTPSLWSRSKTGAPLHHMEFTQRSQSALRLAHECSAELGHSYVGSEHLLLGLSREGRGVASTALKGMGLDYKQLHDTVAKLVGTGTPVSLPAQGLTPQCIKIIEYSLGHASRLGHSYVGTEHLLLGVMQERTCSGFQVLHASGTDQRKLYTAISSAMGGENSSKHNNPSKPYAQKDYSPPSDTKLLEQFCRDLTRMASNGTLDPVVGREREITRVIQILTRRQKNNPALIGEPGVGKTAVAEGLARRIVAGDVPEDLQKKRLLSLDLSSMVAGTKYRGEFEERIKHLLNDVRKVGNIILFIDELHTIVGAGSAEGAIDAANIIKPALGRGDIQVLGATTTEEYRRYIEKDAALERRFQPVIIEEPNYDTALIILHSLADRYEAHHRLHITDEALEAAISLSSRYISDRRLPDKAIDLMDEAASRVRMERLSLSPALRNLSNKVAETSREKDLAIRSQDYERAAMLRDAEGDFRRELDRQRENLAVDMDANTVTAEDVAAVVSTWTGIPVTALTESESHRLLRLEDELHQRVVGQEEAISAVARAVRRGRVGLKEPNRPTGCFLFLGPTGVGKTELCRTLAHTLFGSADALIRLDMSEYMEKHTISRLIGAPPGYVGHEEGGQLTEKVRRKPYCVLLFDEIEKAHTDIWGILLQIMEEGQVTDAQGRKTDFKNTVIVMTSNIGASRITGRGGKLGFVTPTGENQETRPQCELKKAVIEDLKKVFRPEFLNRLDETIVFTQLGRQEIQSIARTMIEGLAERMAHLGLFLTVTEEAIALLSQQGFDPDYGARPLRRTIRSQLEDKISELILSGQLPPGSTLEVATLQKELQLTPVLSP